MPTKTFTAAAAYPDFNPWGYFGTLQCIDSRAEDITSPVTVFALKSFLTEGGLRGPLPKEIEARLGELTASLNEEVDDAL